MHGDFNHIETEIHSNGNYHENEMDGISESSAMLNISLTYLTGSILLVIQIFELDFKKYLFFGFDIIFLHKILTDFCFSFAVIHLVFFSRS